MNNFFKNKKPPVKPQLKPEYSRLNLVPEKFPISGKLPLTGTKEVGWLPGPKFSKEDLFDPSNSVEPGHFTPRVQFEVQQTQSKNDHSNDYSNNHSNEKSDSHSNEEGNELYFPLDLSENEFILLYDKFIISRSFDLNEIKNIMKKLIMDDNYDPSNFSVLKNMYIKIIDIVIE